MDVFEGEDFQDQRLSLADPTVVDGLIRHFAQSVLGLVGKPDFMARLDFECRRINGLFLGLIPNDAYTISPWNSPDQLGVHVLLALRINGATRLGVRDAFMWLAAKLIDAYELGDAFRSASVDTYIAQLRNALLGSSSQESWINATA